jgi:hypothetical protein
MLYHITQHQITHAKSRNWPAILFPKQEFDMSSLIHKPPPLHPIPQQITKDQGPASISEGRIGGLRFDWLISVLNVIFLGGLYLDGWAHNHDRTDETFFTVWHAIFYSGFLLIALLLAGTMWVNRRRDTAWKNVLPQGYSLSLLGILIFAAGGVGDLLWHEIFGVEAGFDALFSPSHLVLGMGLGLVITGPLRAVWSRPGQRLSWVTGGPALISLTAFISLLTFFTMGAHPLASNIAGARHDYDSRMGEIAGVGSLLVTTAILMGPLLLGIRRWWLPPGSLVLVLGINTVVMAVVNWHHDYTLWLMLAMLAAVLVAEGVRLRMEPLMSKMGAFHGFAALLPFLLMGSYFIAMLSIEGTDWSVHLWTGTVTEAGIVGWLLSYLVVPPPMPVEVAK